MNEEKGTPKRTIKHKRTLDKSAEILKDSEGKERFVVVTEEVTYTFTNLRPGYLFFKRSDGKEDFFDGNETKTDINEKERELLKKSMDYKNGWLVEQKEYGSADNINALTDEEIKFLIEENRNVPDKLEAIVNKIDSDFTIKRLRDAFLEHNLQASLVKLCDYKLEKLEDEYLASQKAPVFRITNKEEK